jgi:hypothetical protein
MTHDGGPLHFAKVWQYPYDRSARRYVGVYVEQSGFARTVADFVVVSGLCRHRDSIAPVAADRERFCAIEGASRQRLPRFGVLSPASPWNPASR